MASCSVNPGAVAATEKRHDAGQHVLDKNWGDVQPTQVSINAVEHRRFELLTSSMRTKRATNCANAPTAGNFITGPLAVSGQ